MKVDQQDLVPIALGAAFLATGGGGDPLCSRLAVQALMDQRGPAELIALEDVPDDATVMSVGMSGSPSVAIEKLAGGLEPLWAVQKLEAEAPGRIFPSGETRPEAGVGGQHHGARPENQHRSGIEVERTAIGEQADIDLFLGPRLCVRPWQFSPL